MAVLLMGLAALCLLACAGLLYWGASARRPATWLRLRVLACRQQHDVLLLTLGRRDWRRLPAALPGQYLALQATVGAVPLMRSYSLARWQARPRRYQLAIKREPGGRVSNWLADTLRVGATLRLRAPAGHFVLDGDDDYVLLVAGGVGITPLLAMLDALRARRRPPRRVALLYAARHEWQLLWHQQFCAWAQRLPWFDYHPCLSQPDAHWQGWRGRLDAARLAQATQGWPHVVLYQCASESLMAAVAEAAAKLPLAVTVRQEAFAVAAQGSGQWHPARVDGRDYSVQGGVPLLAELESQLAFADASCRAGECGGCRLQLESGEVEWLRQPQQPLPPGAVLACCCAAAGAVSFSTPRY